nr:uncharacterized protein LOC109168119 [Ipomoea batatas]
MAMTAAPPQPRRQLFSDHDNLQLISSKLGPSGGRARRRRCGGGGFARKCAALVKEQRARNLKRFHSSEQVKTHLIRRGFKQGYDRWIWHGETVLPSTSTGDKRIENNNLLIGAQQNIFKANDMAKDSKKKVKKAKEKHEGNVHPHHLGYKQDKHVEVGHEHGYRYANLGQMELCPELELEETAPPKHENTLSNALLTPPFLRDIFPLVPREILLGTPLLLNPPSISVYTTGSSLLPPENRPTANPPPGNLQIVSPTVSSSEGCCSFEEGRLVVFKSPEFGASVGSWWRQTGQELRKDSQGRMQSEWYKWLQGISRASFPSSKGSLQTAQWGSVSMWEFRISMVGIDSIAALEAGGSSILPNPFASIWVN